MHPRLEENNMQAVLILAILLILAVLGQIPLLIWFVMGVAVVLIFRNGVKSYEENKVKTEDTQQ